VGAWHQAWVAASSKAAEIQVFMAGSFSLRCGAGSVVVNKKAPS
jgi:hypothetical protein